MHWHRPIKLRSPELLLVDHLENVLDTVARCLSKEEALAIWDSALQKQLIDHLSLTSLPFSPHGRALLEECTFLHDSGLETVFKTRLRWIKQPIRPQAWLYGHRVDFLIGDRLVVQIDGKQHEGPSGRQIAHTVTSSLCVGTE